MRLFFFKENFSPKVNKRYLKRDTHDEIKLECYILYSTIGNSQSCELLKVLTIPVIYFLKIYLTHCYLNLLVQVTFKNKLPSYQRPVEQLYYIRRDPVLL